MKLVSEEVFDGAAIFVPVTAKNIHKETWFQRYDI